MTDLGPIEAAIIAAVAGGAGRVVAAPLDGLAEAMRDRMRERLTRVRLKAEAKAGGDLHQVPDRIAFKALHEAAITDDEIAAEYLGGVLAGSGGDDDSGAAVVAQISRMSSRQLLMHFVIYRELRRLWREAPLNLGDANEAQKARLKFTIDDLRRLFPKIDMAALMADVLPRLRGEGLIGDDYSFRGQGTEPGFTVRATGAGATLFLWGHGIDCPHPVHLFDDKVHGRPMVFKAAVPPTSGAMLIEQRSRRSQ